MIIDVECSTRLLRNIDVYLDLEPDPLRDPLPLLLRLLLRLLFEPSEPSILNILTI
jgi:hypothetical protein